MLPVTLAAAAGCALLNLWLSFRIGQVRHAEKIDVGDGGNERLIRRMRAQANFVENAPFVLVLLLAIELVHGTDGWLWLAAGAFLLARVAHGLGMDGGRFGAGRTIGTGVTLAVLLALGMWAAWLAVTTPHMVTTTTEVPASA